MRLSSMLAVSLALLTVAGCGKGNFSERASAGSEGTFRYPISAKPTTLDPGWVEDGDTIDMLQQVFEGLVAYGEDNKIEGILAKDWEVSDDGKIYTFHIKEGVKFHSGRELTAADFKYCIERNANPDIDATTAGTYLTDIVGMAEFREKDQTKRAKEITGVRVKDDYTLEIEIDQRRPYFLGKLCYPVSWVYDKDAVNPTVQMKDVKQMVGTGPFKAESYKDNDIVVLVANPDYHLGAPKIARIERPIMGDAQLRSNKFTQGEIDLVALERQEVPAFIKDAKFKEQIHQFPRPSIFYVGMNQRMYPVFKNAKVRRAFAMAINKKRIVDEVLGGLVKEANSIVPPGVPGHREDANVIPYDPAGARKLLAEAGYPDGKGLPEFQMDVRLGKKDYEDVAVAVAADLRNNLKIKVGVQPTEWATYLTKRNNWQIGLFHMRWAADYLDPQNFLSMMLGTYPYGPENRMDYSNPEFDRLCQQADTMADETERMRLYAQAEDVVLQDAGWIPIYFQQDTELINPRVKGLRNNLFGHLPHYTVSLEK